MHEVQQETLDNKVCPQIKHLRVFQQQRGSACGFHMLWNAKCLVRAMLATKKYYQLLNICLLNSPKHFYNHTKYVKDLLLKCTNSFYVSKQDKEYIKQGEEIIERSHLSYLLRVDRELRDLQTNPKVNPTRVQVFIEMLDFSFGLVHRGID